VGLLLCIRINTQLALELQRRRVPALEGYTNATNMLIWPRFQYVMSLHIDSMKKMFNSKSVMSAVKDIHPHYVSWRETHVPGTKLTGLLDLIDYP
jgi:hypothetical protein